MARKQGHNKVVFEEKIKDQLNTVLRKDIADPRLTMLSFTRVELSNDYSYAKVYWDTFDSSKRGDIKKALDGVQNKLRSILAKEMKVRHTPALELIYDSTFEDEMKITNLLSSEKDSE